MGERENQIIISSLEETLRLFPSRPETSEVDVVVDKKRERAMVNSMVSRNREGVIVYVVPGSIHYGDADLAARISKSKPEE